MVHFFVFFCLCIIVLDRTVYIAGIALAVLLLVDRCLLQVLKYPRTDSTLYWYVLTFGSGNPAEAFTSLGDGIFGPHAQMLLILSAR